MANENKPSQPDSKKSFPTTFFFLLMVVVLVVLTVQNFVNTKSAKVAFSYQVESLVNLNLLVPDDNRKVALNDNLVTFSGQFREKETEEGKRRFKFLELLEQHHELVTQRDELLASLSVLEQSITSAGQWFLELSGLPLPATGYRVVEDTYDLSDRKNSIVIRQVPADGVVSLMALRGRLEVLKRLPNVGWGQVEQFQSDLATLVADFRSPILGIGSEELKQQLRGAAKNLADLEGVNAPADRFVVYEQVLATLQGVVDDLNQLQDHVRLASTRSVRQYREDLERLALLATQLEQNQAQLDKARQSVAQVIWYFNNQELSTRALERQDPEVYSRWFVNAKEEWEHFSTNKGLPFKAPDQPRNLVLEKTFKSEEPAPNYFSYLLTLLPVLLVVMLLYFIFSRQLRGMGSGAMNFGKSPARLWAKGQTKVTFKDVAGIDEAKEELIEIVDFLKNPAKFTALGGKIPKGILCIGPPGTGKTLIAKAVAGEAERPFFFIAGSDFVEMFVGVGASRIRDLFEQAKKNAPCIIFVDEIDAVGRHRGAGIGGGHDEREQTLNQLLVEMDGFDTNEGVIVVAATNRPDVLDKALLRPGRFDRRVVINLPDIKGRFEILKVHARRIKIDPTVDLMAIARATPGASGADLESILNEAALLAARNGRSAVTAQETVEACDKVRYGKERRSLEIDENEKRTTAYHESGHAMVGLVVKKADPVEKVTIIPRGLSLGATHFLPKKNRVSYWKTELLDQLAVLMGGRCAEEIFLEDISSGARMDITQATRLARSMVCEWGMSDVLGAVAYDDSREGSNYLGVSYAEKNYSAETAKAIDEEVRGLIDAANARAKEIIDSNRARVVLMAEMLIEFETLDAEDVQEILNDEWSVEKKRRRMQETDNRHKRKEPLGSEPLPPSEKREGDLGIVPS